MRLLLFSDLHGDRDAARRLVALAGSVDVIVGAGDFGNAHHGVADCIPILSQIAVPAVLVPGNNETLDELVEACRDWKTATVLHGTGITINGVPFFGVGGGIPVTPFGAWSYDFTEAEGEMLLADCPQSAVLVSHSPPKGVADVSSSGRSLGSEAVREAMVRTRARLVVCGHIHASAGQTDFLGATPVVNAGPEGVLFDLP
ncbi:MAG: metallophosphoesterase family protein [Fibrella sp.]|nr:metallophosphoesterase family protein [Armatimonadota bacterium]